MRSEELAAWRLRNLRLDAEPLGSAHDVLAWLGAVQSQDYAGGKWSIGQRTRGLTDTDLDAAFNKGELLRTHVLRSTWHFVRPADIRWMLELTAPRVHAFNTHYARQFGVHDVLVPAQTVIERALSTGGQLTRKELQYALKQAGFDVHGIGLAYVLMHAELNGVICSGAIRGKQHTYALLEARAPLAQRLTRDEALAELTRRYFSSHGPATTADFAWWSSLTQAEIKRGLELVGGELASLRVDNTTYWVASGSPPPPPPSSGNRAYLLQGFDEFCVGYGVASKAASDVSGAATAHAQGQGVFTHVIVVGTQVAGRWKRTLSRTEVVLEADIFAPLSADDRAAVEAAVDEYGRFVGLPARLRVIQKAFQPSSA